MIIGAQIIVMGRFNRLGIYMIITSILLSAILLLRTYALHNRDKRVLCLLVLACIAGTTISTVSRASYWGRSTDA
jgi:hypothetical protein